MMRGYDREEAIAYMAGAINRKTHQQIEGLIDSMIAEAIDADMAFMHKTGVIDAEGNAGNAYYDDDDAFESILDVLVSKHKLNADDALTVAEFLDDFFDLQQNYLESKGLVDWD